MTSGSTLLRRMPSFCPAQFHRKSTLDRTPIPTAIGRGLGMTLTTEMVRRNGRQRKLVVGVESTDSVPVLKARSCIQFRGGAGTVLRTGGILTLHPFEGAAKRSGALQSAPFRMNDLHF